MRPPCSAGLGLHQELPPALHSPGDLKADLNQAVKPQRDPSLTDLPRPCPRALQPGFCDLSQPLTSSCAQVESFLYNSPDPSSTVFEFILTEADPSSGCTMDTDVNFRVLLQPTIVQELMASDSINPSSGVLNM